MRVPTEVLEDLRRSAEGRLGVDDPVGAVESIDEALEGLRVRQSDQREPEGAGPPPGPFVGGMACARIK
jgi:hypothetical protein